MDSQAILGDSYKALNASETFKTGILYMTEPYSQQSYL